jgi:hypothetical protein
MKNIKQIEIWSKGSLKIGNFISIMITGDNLKDTCLFRYTIKKDENCHGITQGSIKITGQDYIDWSGSNDEAYEYVCDQLNLELI